MDTVRTIFVASTNRDTALYPTGSNYVLHLTTPVKNVYKAELVSASIPNSLYNVPDGSNFCVINGIITCNIPSGFYSASVLALELTQSVSSSGVTIYYLPGEGKFLFTASSSFTLEPSVNSLEVLGFNDTSSKSSQDGSVDPLFSGHSRYNTIHYIKSDKVVSMNPHDGVFLDIHELRTPNNIDTKQIVNSSTGFYSGLNISRIFGYIPMDVSSGAIKNFKTNTDFQLIAEYPYPIPSLDRLTVEWIDKNGQRLSFNGLEDNSFILKLYSRNKTF